MCSVQNPHSAESQRSMAPHKAVEDLTSDPVASSQSRTAEQPTAAHPAEEVNPNMKYHSLAVEFKYILSDPRRDEGVKGDKKHAKRESITKSPKDTAMSIVKLTQSFRITRWYWNLLRKESTMD